MSALRKIRLLLHDQRVKAVPDHYAFISILKDTEGRASGRRARWIDALAEYDLSLHHRAGALNAVADGLSRKKNDGMNLLEDEPEDPSLLLNLDKLTMILEGEATSNTCN